MGPLNLTPHLGNGGSLLPALPGQGVEAFERGEDPLLGACPLRQGDRPFSQRRLVSGAHLIEHEIFNIFCFWGDHPQRGSGLPPDLVLKDHS